MPGRCVIALLALALALAGCGGAARVGGSPTETRVLTLLNPIDDRSEVVGFTDQVARLSKGALRIRIVTSRHVRQTDYEDAAIRDVEAGRADLGWAASRAWKGSLRALNAPLLIDSYALEERVLQDDLVSRMLGELRPLGLVGLGVLPGPLRKPVGLDGPLLAPRDFRGRAIGDQQSAVADATLRALGASPVRLAAVPDTSRLAGLETQMAAIDGYRLDAAGSHVTGNVSLWPRPLVLFANANAFAKLTSAERRTLRAAAASAVPLMAAHQRRGERESAGNVCRRGRMTFDAAPPADVRALHAAVEPVYRDLERDPATRAALEDIAALKRQVAAPPSVVAACERSAPPQPHAQTLLDGSWQMDSKRSASAPEYLDENWGHWRFVFDRGRFAITQENPASCTWGYGTYTVAGDTTTWQFTDGGGQAPDDAENKPGERFSYRLSVFRNTVTLGPVPGATSPANFDAEPWRRIGSPSRAKLSRRCPPPATALPR